jgi:HPr kinase/phosphorylase
MTGQKSVGAQEPGRLQVQGTCVALDGMGLLLRGPSGAGKSDLALRLVEGGGVLVADDLCQIRREGDRLLADLPAEVDPAFRGRIEKRGFGIVSLPYFGPVPLGLVVDLRRPGLGERLPASATLDFLGLALPLIVLDPFQPSAVARLRLLAKRGLVA